MINQLLDKIDIMLCGSGVLSCAKWDKIKGHKPLNLYAGRLPRGETQFQDYIGLAYNSGSLRNINHDLTKTFPLEDSVVDRFQSQDVFEHIEYSKLPAVFAEIYRVLKPGSLFRLSVPDYRSPVYYQRSLMDEAGEICFDPGGGGSFEAGKVVDGGHVWFPRYESVKMLFDDSSFATEGSFEFKHYIGDQGNSVMSEIDHDLGLVKRTPDHDPRVQSPRQVLSIVVDAWKGSN